MKTFEVRGKIKYRIGEKKRIHKFILIILFISLISSIDIAMAQDEDPIWAYIWLGSPEDFEESKIIEIEIPIVGVETGSFPVHISSRRDYPITIDGAIAVPLPEGLEGPSPDPYNPPIILAPLDDIVDDWIFSVTPNARPGEYVLTFIVFYEDPISGEGGVIVDPVIRLVKSKRILVGSGLGIYGIMTLSTIMAIIGVLKMKRNGKIKDIKKD